MLAANSAGLRRHRAPLEPSNSITEPVPTSGVRTVTNSTISEPSAANSLVAAHGSSLPLPIGHHTDAAKSLLGVRAGEFVLRINAGPQAGRTIRLSSPKCTIGSAPNCTLRLRGKGIEPVHCVVLHGARQTIVRRWASDTFINDHRFEDEALRAGDRLAIGALEFQVVSLPGRVPVPAEPVRNFELEAKLEKLLVAQLTERLNIANRQARRRLRAVIGKLRKFQIRMSELETRRRTNTHEQEQLAAEKAKLAALESDLQAKAAELEQKRAATAAEDRALVEQAERLRASSKQWNLDRAASQQALDQKRLELDAAAARLAGDGARLQKEQTEIAGRSEALAKRVEELARRDAELNVRASVLERSVGKLQDERREIETRAAELNAAAERQTERDAELTQRAAALRTQTTEFEQRFIERDRLLTERETEVARRTSKLLERERSEVARAQSQADALARQWAVIQAVSDQQQRAAGSQSAGNEELDARAKALEAQAAETAKSAAALESQAADIAARRSALIDTSRDLDARASAISAQEAAVNARLSELDAQTQAGELRTTDLDRREEAYREQLRDLGRQSEEVARRCETLKQNWSELNERERRLAEREEACRAAEAAAAQAAAEAKIAAEAAAAAMAVASLNSSASVTRDEMPVVVSPPAADTITIDSAAVDQLMNDLTEREAEIRALNERVEQLTLQSNVELRQAAAKRAEVEAELQTELATLRLRDQESQAGQAAMLEATTIYEAKLAELTAELESLRAVREERDQEIARTKETCDALQREAEALTREADELRAELASHERFTRVVETSAPESAAPEVVGDDEGSTAESTTEREFADSPVNDAPACEVEPRAELDHTEIGVPADESSTESIITDEEFEVGARRPADDVEVEHEAAKQEEEPTAEETDAASGDAPEIDIPEIDAEESSSETSEASTEASSADGQAKAGESAADVLRRLGMAAVLDDNGDQTTPTPAPKKAPEPPRPAAPEPAAADHDEDSLNDYMAQLMQRLGVRNDAQAAPAAKAAEPARTMMSRPATPAATVPKSDENKPALAPLEPGEFKARSVAAERNSDLTALRALANANARTAITTHQIKTTKTASKWKGIVASTALITSGVGGYFYFLGHQEGLYCMATGVLVAAAFGLQSFGLKHSAQKSTRSLDDVLTKSNAKMNAENNAAEAARNA